MSSGTPLFPWESPQPQAEIPVDKAKNSPRMGSIVALRFDAISACQIVMALSMALLTPLSWLRPCHGGVGLSPANQPQVGVVLLLRMSNNVCSQISSCSCRIMTHRGAPVPEFLSARNSTKRQLLIGVPNAGNSQKEGVYAATVMWVIGLDLQLQSMMSTIR